jgi:hypothetical protein
MRSLESSNLPAMRIGSAAPLALRARLFRDGEIAVVERAEIDDLQGAFEIGGKGEPVGHDAGAQRQRTILHLPARQLEGAAFTVEGRTPVYAPRTAERLRRNLRVKAGDVARAAGLLIDELDLAAGDRDIFQDDGAGGDIGFAAACPIQGAVLEEFDARLRLLDAHVEDQRLAGEERRQFRVHREARDFDQRPSVLGRADAHVVERYGGKRDQPRIDAAMHDHGAAHDAARLALEILAETRPVNEDRRQQRCKERHDHQAANEEHDPRKHAACLEIPSFAQDNANFR